MSSQEKRSASLDLLRSIVQTLYPKGVACIVCGKELRVNTRYGICNECRPLSVGNYCQICGVEINGTKKYCDACLYENRIFDQARAPFCFDNEDIKKLVYGLKYGDKTYFAPYMAEFMADVFYRQQWFPDVVTYVPIHKYKRIFTRGYDQAKLIAAHLSGLLKLPLEQLLEKNKNTKSNAAKLGRADRRKVLENSFTLKAEVRGKNILLIDDVFTSGATTEECSRVFRKGRAANIWVLTFATSKEKLPLYSLEDGEKILNKFIQKNGSR